MPNRAKHRVGVYLGGLALLMSTQLIKPLVAEAACDLYCVLLSATGANASCLKGEVLTFKACQGGNNLFTQSFTWNGTTWTQNCTAGLHGDLFGFSTGCAQFSEEIRANIKPTCKVCYTIVASEAGLAKPCSFSCPAGHQTTCLHNTNSCSLAGAFTPGTASQSGFVSDFNTFHYNSNKSDGTFDLDQIAPEIQGNTAAAPVAFVFGVLALIAERRSRTCERSQAA